MFQQYNKNRLFSATAPYSGRPEFAGSHNGAQRILEIGALPEVCVEHAFELIRICHDKTKVASERAIWALAEVLLRLRKTSALRRTSRIMLSREVARLAKRVHSDRSQAFLSASLAILDVKHSVKKLPRRVERDSLGAMFAMRCLEILYSRQANMACRFIAEHSPRRQYRIWAASILVYHRVLGAAQILSRILKENECSVLEEVAIVFALACSGDRKYLMKLQSIVYASEDTTVITYVAELMEKWGKAYASVDGIHLRGNGGAENEGKSD